MAGVRRWLGEIGLGQYADLFDANDVDMEALQELTDQDLTALGVSLGHRRKLLKAIRDRTAAVGRRRLEEALAIYERLGTLGAPDEVRSLLA
jgi:hypothetical protein